MRRVLRNLEAARALATPLRLLMTTWLLLTLASTSDAQQLIPGDIACRVTSSHITYPSSPLPYPDTSGPYAVQYRIGFGAWIDATVYTSVYGATNASPSNDKSGYSSNTSMSFVSIPVRPLAFVQLRVTRVGDRFRAGDHPSVRPSVKLVGVELANDGTVLLSRLTEPGFAGEQFLLWWGDATAGAAVQGLAFFLDPQYTAPTTGSVKTITGTFDPLTDLSGYDTIDFEGQVSVGPAGNQLFTIPRFINTVYFGAGAWVQGKLRFKQTGNAVERRIYGPGVLDVSRFEYDLRACDDNSPYPEQGDHAISIDPRDVPDTFLLDGIVITDHNHATADLLVNSTINNVKSIGWNGLNGGFRLGDHTTASNIFLRSGDDSLMMWGASVTVTNATVWQNYNGGVVNLGWGDTSPGDDGLIDGLYVVKTDWILPVATDAVWNAANLNAQNDAVFTSLMVPGTMFGTVKPSVYRNIFIEDAPRTLFSLRILSPQCSDENAPRAGECDQNAPLTATSVLNLNIENLFTPPSTVENSIGFATLPDNSPMPGYKLQGTMKIGLVNVWGKSADGRYRLLTRADPTVVGRISTNDTDVHIFTVPVR